MPCQKLLLTLKMPQLKVVDTYWARGLRFMEKNKSEMISLIKGSHKKLE